MFGLVFIESLQELYTTVVQKLFKEIAFDHDEKTKKVIHEYGVVYHIRGVDEHHQYRLSLIKKP
jgi:hypothetical protein